MGLSRICKECGTAIDEKRIDSIWCSERCCTRHYQKERRTAVLTIMTAAQLEGRDATRARIRASKMPIHKLRSAARKADRTLLSSTPASNLAA